MVAFLSTKAPTVSKMAFASGCSTAAEPTMIIGRLAEARVLPNGPARVDLRLAVVVPRCSKSKVLAKVSPTRPMWRSERRYCLRMRALRTAASWRGLVATRRMASASSMP